MHSSTMYIRTYIMGGLVEINLISDQNSQPTSKYYSKN